jgi:hypothetical protein
VVNSRLRRERGTRGIVQVGDGAWRVDVELLREPGHPRRRVSKTVRGTRPEAEEFLSDLRSENRCDVEVLGVRLPVDLSLALRHAAKADGVSVSEEIRLAIVDRLRRRCR